MDSVLRNLFCSCILLAKPLIAWLHLYRATSTSKRKKYTGMKFVLFAANGMNAKANNGLRVQQITYDLLLN